MVALSRGGRHLVFATFALAIVSLSTSSNSATRIIRRLAADCIQNVYAENAEEAKKIPSVPESSTDSVPAYLALCQEWIRHDAYYQDSSYESYRVVEDNDVCMDWSAPHMALMDIYAALTVSAHVPRMKYRHNCDRTKTYSETLTGYDHTTVQQVLNTPGLRSNNAVMSVDALKQQCRRCLLAYDPQLEVARVKAKGFHHCFAFPEDFENVRNLDPDEIPYVPYSYPGVAAFSTIIVAFRQRLYHAALEWQAVTGMPPNERDNGIVYWLDPTTIGLKYEDVLAEIRAADIIDIRSISILAGPLCASGILPTGEVCHDYGVGLKDYLVGQFPELEGKGFDGEHGVTFKLIMSTAAANSRMILSQMLICPPRSPSCLFPSVAKRNHVNKALVLDDPSWMKSVDFMSIAGHHGTTTTKILDASKIPPTYTEAPSSGGRKLESKQQQQINALTDPEGYPQGSTRPPLSSDAVIDSMTPQQILDDLTIAMDRFKENPNKHMMALEVIPTMKEIQDALQNGTPLRAEQLSSYQHPSKGTGGENYRHGELSTDADSGHQGNKGTVEYWEGSDVQRHASLLRMQKEWETAFYGHVQGSRTEDDPSTIYEIKCPNGRQLDGSYVQYLHGDAVTVTSDMTIVASLSGVIEIKDHESGVVIESGIENAPHGTVYRHEHGYRIKEKGDGTSTKRRLVRLSNDDLTFKSEIQKVCNKYKETLDSAVKEHLEKVSQMAAQIETDEGAR